MKKALIAGGVFSFFLGPVSALCYGAVLSTTIQSIAYVALIIALIFSLLSILFDNTMGKLLYPFTKELAASISLAVGIGIITAIFISTLTYAIAFKRWITLAILAAIFLIGLILTIVIIKQVLWLRLLDKLEAPHLEQNQSQSTNEYGLMTPFDGF
jgi:membrane protein implicated in regulation of membrane protease activity